MLDKNRLLDWAIKLVILIDLALSLVGIILGTTLLIVSPFAFYKGLVAGFVVMACGGILLYVGVRDLKKRWKQIQQDRRMSKCGFTTERTGLFGRGRMYWRPVKRAKRPDPSCVCWQCGNMIDPDVCNCGIMIDDHTELDNHVAIPMGCDCGRLQSSAEPH